MTTGSNNGNNGNILQTNGMNPNRISVTRTFDPLERTSPSVTVVGRERHGFGDTDNVIFGGKNGKAGEKAWHGMGVYLEDEVSPVGACKIAGFDYNVKQAPMKWTRFEDRNGVSIPVHSEVATHVMNYRSDNNGELGVVGVNYQPVDNVELAQFAVDLAGEGKSSKVKIESAGTYLDGRRVWFLVRVGEAYEVTNNDYVAPYMLVSNSHDGTQAVRVNMTDIRVVCKNTHRVARNAARKGWNMRHTTNVKERITEAKKVLGLALNEKERQIEAMRSLATTTLTREETQAFWMEVFQKIEGHVASTPATAKERKHREFAAETLAAWSSLFDRDIARVGRKAERTLWTATNAVTEFYTHERKMRAKDAERASRREYANMFGHLAENKDIAFDTAFAMIEA